MFQTYRPSGAIGLLSFPGLLAALAAAIALGFVYQLLLEWIPLIYVNALLTVVSGFVLGFVGSMVVNTGKARNVVFGVTTGLLLVAALLASKNFFQYQNDIRTTTNYVMLEQEIPPEQRAEVRQQVANNLTFAEHIKFRVKQGWNIGKAGRNGAPISGVFVYVIWLIEAGIVLFFTVPAVVKSAGQPFNEQLNEWASEAEQIMTLPITDEEMVAKISEANTVEQLLEIPIPQTDQSKQFAVYQVNSIPGHELEDAYLTVKTVTFSLNPKGEEETTEKTLVKNAILPTAQRKQLVENASLLQEALADFRAATDEDEAEAAAAESESDAS